MLDIGLKFYAVSSPYPLPLTDFEINVTDIQLFCLMKCFYHINQSAEAFIFHISNRVCFHSITTDPVDAMGWTWRSKELSHILMSLNFFFFFFFWSCILILLGRCHSGKLRCAATALNVISQLFYSPQPIEGFPQQRGALNTRSHPKCQQVKNLVISR